MKRQAYKNRYFKCPVCGSTQTASKRTGHLTKLGHIKHMTCFQCMEIRPMVQVSEWESESTLSAE